MNRVGGKVTREGGEDIDRFTPDPNGDSRRSSIKQVASGRFGVTSIIWSMQMKSRLKWHKELNLEKVGTAWQESISVDCASSWLQLG
jgi:glutamate synthase domain-containing protein 2